MLDGNPLTSLTQSFYRRLGSFIHKSQFIEFIQLLPLSNIAGRLPKRLHHHHHHHSYFLISIWTILYGNPHRFLIQGPRTSQWMALLGEPTNPSFYNGV